MNILSAASALAPLALFGIQPAGHAGTFMQLISTRYAAEDALPQEFRKPAPAFGFVDAGKLPAGAKILSAAHTKRGAVWVVTDKGAFRLQDGAYVPLETPRSYKPLQPPVPTDLRVRFVTDAGGDYLVAATENGMVLSDGADWWRVVDRKDGMPYDNLICVHAAPNGDIWGGTRAGAWRWRNGNYRYFWGKRWLPGNTVSAIWSDEKGMTWLETDRGVARIEERPMTLAEKAAYYDRITQERHNRRGYISSVDLKVAGHPEQGVMYHADDNDGLWTSYYVAAMALRYAVTKDEEARKHAQRSMRAMIDLERLTGIPGFPARSTVTDDELKAGVTGYDANSVGGFPGETVKQWFRSPIQHDIWCKGDTSSDEIDGHYMAWYLYTEFVADPAERAEITALVRRTTDHIIAHHYTLVGESGKMTRWGVWGPQFINDDPTWTDQRGLNSIEILSHLKVAIHITGDAKYQAAYDDLIDNHHYLLNALEWRRAPNLNWWEQNHSDDQLSYVAYYPLLMLERDPQRRRILTESVARTWEDSFIGELTLKSERSSFYNFAYGAMTGNPCDPESGIADLEDWPWELIDWRAENSQRHDIALRTHKGREGRNGGETDRALPASERGIKKWNGSVWEADTGGVGKGEEDGAAWLIGYWLGVHHGYIDKNR
jgi:hypothetical protein